MKTLEILAVAAHGGSAVLNLLGIIFHVSNERTLLDRDVAINAVCLVYHVNAIRKHAKRL